MATVPIRLSVINNKINIDPDSCKVNVNDTVSFFTEDENKTFEVAVHNPDYFFTGIPRLFSGNVVESTPLEIQIDNPGADNNVKYYSVCELNINPQPLPPDAPPRIIVHT